MDLALAAVLILVLIPLMAVIALLVLIDVGLPVLFRQERPGRGGQPFQMLKFRTMLALTDAEGRPLDNSLRLTRFGRCLRSTSLDELPELWNVLKGDMSLVGPRPLLMEYLSMYTPRQSRRHEVRPGITGWAQVNGRNLVPWEERFEMDVWYVDNRTFWLDFKILARTLVQIFTRHGIAPPGRSTIDRFRATR